MYLQNDRASEATKTVQCFERGVRSRNGASSEEKAAPESSVRACACKVRTRGLVSNSSLHGCLLLFIFMLCQGSTECIQGGKKHAHVSFVHEGLLVAKKVLYERQSGVRERVSMLI